MNQDIAFLYFSPLYFATTTTTRRTKTTTEGLGPDSNRKVYQQIYLDGKCQSCATSTGNNLAFLRVECHRTHSHYLAGMKNPLMHAYARIQAIDLD